MLSAQDREQVVKWSQRQLGQQARLISIFEQDCSKTVGFIEKSGTGITALEAEGCQPIMSIMADIIENVPFARVDHMEGDRCVRGSRRKDVKPTFH